MLMTYSKFCRVKGKLNEKKICLVQFIGGEDCLLLDFQMGVNNFSVHNFIVYNLFLKVVYRRLLKNYC